MSRPKNLPDFDKPPVNEVIASVQFEPVALPLLALGQWFEIIKDRYPHVEEKPPIEPRFEEFGAPPPPRVQLKVLHQAPSPRLWFMNEPGGDELLQLQNDRLVFNWRGQESKKPYPRYEFVRERFVALYGEFNQFCVENELGSIVPNQCEISYLNHLNKGEGWENISDWEGVLKFCKDIRPKDSELEIDNYRNTISYTIKGVDGIPYARFHVICERRFYVQTMEPVLYLELSVRGVPREANIEGIIDFMDKAREVIVDNFANMTEKKMHEIWGRNDGK